jgi:pyrroloquinoline-quinone synthase
MTVPTTSRIGERLQAVIESKSMLQHPFYQGWSAGTLPMERMQEYARQYYHFEAAFPRFLSAIHARTESAEVRQMLLENLWDEEHGERNHPRLWLDFAKAINVPERDVREATIRPETRGLIEHYKEAAEQAPIGEALATLYAYEGQVPSIAWQKIRGLTECYGLRPDQFEFFSVHLVADVAHSGHEMAAIEEYCEDEDVLVSATAAACDRLLSFLDGCMATEPIQ